VNHTADFDPAPDEPIVDQIPGIAKPPQAWSKVVARYAQARVFREHSEPLLDPADEAIRLPTLSRAM
jgi:hypothetical protein